MTLSHRGYVFSCALRKLIEQREKLDLEIERSVDYITPNANFLRDDEREEELDKLAQLVAGPPGFTGSVRNVLRNNPSYAANAISVRDMLQKAGFDLSGYSNPLASIHTISKRLGARGEVSVSVVNGNPFTLGRPMCRAGRWLTIWWTQCSRAGAGNEFGRKYESPADTGLSGRMKQRWLSDKRTTTRYPDYGGVGLND